MLYVFKFSLLTGKTTIHAPTCRNATKRHGAVVGSIEAPTAPEAARMIEAQEELIARQYPYPTICRCAQ